MRTVALVALAAIASLGACSDTTTSGVDAAVRHDGSVELGADPDGGPPLGAAFTVIGCASLTYSGAAPRCAGSAPLSLTFVPLGSSVTDFLWTFADGSPSMSTAITPAVTFARPGTFKVTLAAGGLAGTTLASGTVVVKPGELGAPCKDSVDCDPSTQLSCVCASGACPGGLAAGLCTSACVGGCGAGVCADLTRGGGGAPDGGANADAGVATGAEWRSVWCLASCATASDCRAGLICREVPALGSGGVAGGPYTWHRACFADVPGDVGDSCFDASGAPSGARCLSGRCDAYGARGLCTAACGGGATCPSTASCATFNGTPGSSLCLRLCDPLHPCADPLLDCEPRGGTGALGFTVAGGDPPTTTWCAPRRCTQPTDCAPSGTCTLMGGSSFCARN